LLPAVDVRGRTAARRHGSFPQCVLAVGVLSCGEEAVHVADDGDGATFAKFPQSWPVRHGHFSLLCGHGLHLLNAVMGHASAADAGQWLVSGGATSTRERAKPRRTWRASRRTELLGCCRRAARTPTSRQSRDRKSVV